MKAQTVFKRYELKYALTMAQYEAMKLAMEGHMKQDAFGRHTIHNVYYDTADYLLIRRSLEKPCYKEKLRVRSYNDQENVFVELKKKYDGVVYKRRMELPRTVAQDFLSGRQGLEASTQISREIDYFVQHYGTLRPMMYLDYEREAYYDPMDDALRITFDHNVRIAQENAPITDGDTILLEVKTAMGIPAWLLEFFGKEAIYKTSFSKYGTAYTQYRLPNLKGGAIHVA